MIFGSWEEGSLFSWEEKKGDGMKRFVSFSWEGCCLLVVGRAEKEMGRKKMMQTKLSSSLLYLIVEKIACMHVYE